MTWAAFKAWYMSMYFEFDKLFVVSAKFLGITYHEFVLLSLVVVWPVITVALLVMVIRLWWERRHIKCQPPFQIKLTSD